MPRLRTGSIFLRGKIYWIAYRDQTGEQQQESSHSTKREDADRLLKRRQGEVVTGKFAGLGPERITFGELAQEILDDYAENGRKSSAWVERRLRLHLLPQFAKVRAAEFSSDHLKRYRQSRKKQSAANGTINRELAIVKRVFRLALQSDPPKIARAPYVQMLKESNVRTGFLEHDDYMKFRDALPEDLRLLLVVGYHFGTRLGELKALHWPQVDLEALEVRLDPGTTKNDQGRLAPIYGELKEWFKMAKQIRDQNYPACPWVFHRCGKPIKNFRKSWGKAIQASGIPRVLVHDLRRTAARKMRRAGVPDKIIMAVVGWKTRAMLDRYDIVTAADLDVFRGRMEAAEAQRRAADAESLTTIQQQSFDPAAERGAGRASKLLQ
jgi:integrase